MGTSATPKSTGDDSKVNATVIGVGVGLAAGFAAPLLAGVALSAAGFTSTGIADGSLAASWRESSGSIFRMLQSAAEGGLGGTVAAGLGAALGAAAAVVTLWMKGTKPQPPETKPDDHPVETPKPTENIEPANEIKQAASEVVETVTSKKVVPTDVEAKLHKKLDDTTEPEKKKPVDDDDQVAAALEEQIVHVTFIPNQASQSKKPAEETLQHDVKPLAVQDTTAKAVQEVVVEAVVKLASVVQPEKGEIDGPKTEKSEITPDVAKPEAAIPPTPETVVEQKTPAAEQTSSDVVHHATKPEEEAEMLKEAVEQLVETEAVSEELPSIEECCDRDDSRLVSEDIEILSTSEISSPVINSSVTTSLFQELTEEDLQAVQEPIAETIRDVLEKVEQQQTAHAEPASDVTQEVIAPIHSEESLPAAITGGEINAIHHVADQIINEIEFVLSGGSKISHETESKVNEEPEHGGDKDRGAETTTETRHEKPIDEQPGRNETQPKVEAVSVVKVQEEGDESEESEESDEAYEEEEAEESDDEDEEEGDKDAGSEKQTKNVELLKKPLVKTAEKEAPIKTEEAANGQTTTEQELGEFSWDTNDD